MSPFILALVLFIKQHQEIKEDTSLQRLKEFSFRLIDFVGSPNYSLNQNSADILLTYLSSLKSEISSDHSLSHLREYQLALNIVYESLKNTSLQSIMGIESEKSYSKVIETIKSQYTSREKLQTIDSNLIRIIDSEESNGSFAINPPRHALRLHQIKDIFHYVFEHESNEVISHLERKPKNPGDRPYEMPVLFAFYYFYNNAKLAIKKSGEWEIFVSPLLPSSDRQFIKKNKNPQPKDNYFS